MELTPNIGAYAPPAPSLAARSVALASKAHFAGQLVIPDGDDGRVVLAESHLEFCWIIYLLAQPTVKTVVEQVRFAWTDHTGKAQLKYFDIVAILKDGRKLACEVKPTVRLKSGRVLKELRQISGQIEGHFDEVRLLTEKGLDRITLFNAEILFGMADADPDADEAAIALIETLAGSAALGELTTVLGIGARGFRALVRLIGARRLALCHHERISHSALVRREA